MIERGQTLVNPVTGERVVVEVRADPGGSVAASHAHPNQWETCRVVSGTLGAKVAGRKTKLGPGQVMGVAPGVVHTWWNAGEDELVFRCEIRPALQFESLIETMFSRAA
jgi:quercetin dioxygenase-like cupin family protein